MNKRKTIKKVVSWMVWVSVLMLLLLPAIIRAQESGVYLTVEGAPTSNEHTVSVFVEGISPVYGADIRVAFDPNVLEVVDADEATPETIEVIHGDFLTADPDFVLRNQANNQTGQIEYALVLVNPAPPVQGGGLLAQIPFRARASGQTEVKLTQVQFGTQEGEVVEPALGAPVQFNVTQLNDTSTAPTSEEASPSFFQPQGQNTVNETFSTEWLIAAAIAVAVLLILIIMVWRQLRRSQQATAHQNRNKWH